MASYALLPVEPFVGDTAETIGYRSCDLCHQTVVEDIWAARTWRRFYFDAGSGCSVCENCRAAWMDEDA